MDIRILLIELAEKIGLIATAGLICVLVPPLRNRLLGVGGLPRDKIITAVFGMCFAMWGAKLGEWWLGHHMNFRSIGVFMAAVLGGSRVGFITGIGAGAFYIFRVEGSLGVFAFASTVIDGILAGVVVDRAPRWLMGWRAFYTASAIGAMRTLVIGIALTFARPDAPVLSASPAILVEILGNAAGITLFVVVARVVLAREEAAVALIKAEAAADHLSLVALRRRLEPHFLFNALNTLRATIRIDPPRARELVSDLADLYRYLLNHPEDAPLEKEVEHACAFLAIEHARLGQDRLRVVTDIEDEVRLLQVPALLLQPLVENAVNHGIALRESGEVRIHAYRDGQALIVDVEDRGEGERMHDVKDGAGIALATLRERLSRRFDGLATLELLPLENGMRAHVRLPWYEVLAGLDDDPSSKREAAE